MRPRFLEKVRRQRGTGHDSKGVGDSECGEKER
jgi:hypothetical protein